jgi:hypothetical protein
MIARTKNEIKALQDQLENLFAALPQAQKSGSYPAGCVAGRKVLSGNEYELCQKKVGVVRDVEEVKDEI